MIVRVARDIVRNLVRKILPSDKNFWKVYSPVIRILKDSFEHRRIRLLIDVIFEYNSRDVVLEEGCGKAVWLSEIQPKIRRAIGLDIDAGMIRGAMKQVPQASFVQANLNEGVPFKNGTFTKIGSILVLGYLNKPELAIAEQFRTLQPGGMIAVVTPKKGAKFFKVLAWEARERKDNGTFIQNLRKLPLGIIAVLFGKIAEMKAVYGDWNFYELDELRAKYSKAGFEIVAVSSVYAEQAWLLIGRKPS